jgi:hypothetical protein
MPWCWWQTDHQQFNVGVICGGPRSGFPQCRPASDFLTPDQGANVFLTIMLTVGTAGLDALLGPAAAAGGMVGDGSNVLLDTGSVIKYKSAQALLGAGEQPVVNETTAQELIDVAARKGFSGTLPGDVSVIPDNVSMTLRGLVMRQLRMFGAATKGMENDAAIGSTALERGIPLITTDYALANAVMKLGGTVRYLEP